MTFQNKNRLMDRSSYLPSAFGMDVGDTDIICKVKNVVNSQMSHY